MIYFYENVRIKSRVIFPALCFVFMLDIQASESIFLGRAQSQDGIKGTEVSCQEGNICLGSWYKWTVRVDKLIVGPAVLNSIEAARIDTSKYSNLDSFVEFVIKPIDDEKTRRLLGVNYFLVKMKRSEAKIQ